MKTLIQTLLAVGIINTGFSQVQPTDLYKHFLAQVKTGQHATANKTSAVCVKDSMIIQNWKTSTNSWMNLIRYQYAYTSALDMNANTSSNWSGNMWYINNKTTITYDNNHHPLTELQQYINGSTLSNNNLRTKTYDSNGNLLTDLYQHWNPGSSTWVNNSKYIHTYDAANNELSYLSQAWNQATSTWKDNFKTINTYSGNNLVTEIYQYLNSTTNMLENDTKYTYLYDIFNHLVSGIAYSWNSVNLTWENAEKYTATYSGNNMTSVLAQLWTGTAWVNGYKYTATFDANNNMTSQLEESYNSSTSSWVTEYKYIMTYDGHNNQLTSLTQEWNSNTNSLENTDRTTNTYDTHDNLLTQMHENWQITSWLKYQLVSSYYNCKTVGLKELTRNPGTFSLYPNPAQASLNLSTTFEYENIRIYDISGKEILFLTGNPSLINLSSLEKGIYFIQLFDRSNGVVHTEKFIKE